MDCFFNDATHHVITRPRTAASHAIWMTGNHVRRGNNTYFCASHGETGTYAIHEYPRIPGMHPLCMGSVLGRLARRALALHSWQRETDETRCLYHVLEILTDRMSTIETAHPSLKRRGQRTVTFYSSLFNSSLPVIAARSF